MVSSISNNGNLVEGEDPRRANTVMPKPVAKVILKRRPAFAMHGMEEGALRSALWGTSTNVRRFSSLRASHVAVITAALIALRSDLVTLSLPTWWGGGFEPDRFTWLLRTIYYEYLYEVGRGSTRPPTVL